MESTIKCNLKSISILFIIILTLISGCTNPTLEVGTIGSILYECQSTEESYSCLKLSSGIGTRCYLDDSAWYKQPLCPEGWKIKTQPIIEIPNSNFIAIKDNVRYHCYEIKEYCLPNGDISQEKVSIQEVIG